MILKLNVYTDDSLTDIKRTCEADKLKIPYKVAMFIIQSLDDVSLNNEDDIIKFITGNVDKMDKIIRATFGISESELECVDAGELVETLKELYVWAMEKINTLKNGKNEKNVETPVNL